MSGSPFKGQFDIWKRQHFRQGFLFKSFPIKQLQIDYVRPTIEEVQTFAQNLKKKEDNQSAKADDSITCEELLAKTFMSKGSADIGKGDKIRIIQGDLTGMDGQVISIENSDVLFKPSIDGIGDLRVPIEQVSKFFDPGD